MTATTAGGAVHKAFARAAAGRLNRSAQQFERARAQREQMKAEQMAGTAMPCVSDFHEKLIDDVCGSI